MSANDIAPNVGDERASDAAPSALIDRSFWERMAAESPELAGNPEGTQHLVYRFLGKYLPAVLLSHRVVQRQKFPVNHFLFRVSSLSGNQNLEV